MKTPGSSCSDFPHQLRRTRLALTGLKDYQYTKTIKTAKTFSFQEESRSNQPSNNFQGNNDAHFLTDYALVHYSLWPNFLLFTKTITGVISKMRQSWNRSILNLPLDLHLKFWQCPCVYCTCMMLKYCGYVLRSVIMKALSKQSARDIVARVVDKNPNLSKSLRLTFSQRPDICNMYITNHIWLYTYYIWHPL